MYDCAAGLAPKSKVKLIMAPTAGSYFNTKDVVGRGGCHQSIDKYHIALHIPEINQGKVKGLVYATNRL